MISVRQTGHPAGISDTRMAHGSQKRACPHGTNAKPARGVTRHTSQQSSEVDAADDSNAVNGQFFDFYSAVIIRQGLFSLSVQPLFDLVLKLHGLALSGLAMSTPAIWCRVVRSRDVHPCNMVSRCPVSRCQVSRFQRPRLRHLHWLPIRERVFYKLCVLMHDAANGRSSARRSPCSDHRLHQAKFGERAFSFAGPNTWNNLPDELRRITNVTRPTLKTLRDSF